MKVFVSGQIREKNKIQCVYTLLRNSGFAITHDWTQTDDLPMESKFSAEAGIRAAKDVRGVCEADIYIIMTDNEKCGKGMYVEFGAALALAETGKKLDIYVVGPMNHPSVFYNHPFAKHCESIEDCLFEIRKKHLQRQGFAKKSVAA